jgi:hypothetical protein
MGVYHLGEWDEDAIYCYADLGAIESVADRAPVMEEVLTLNLELDAGQGEVIGIERDSRHLVLRVRLPEDRAPMDECELAEQLRSYAELANKLSEKVLIGVKHPIQ